LKFYSSVRIDIRRIGQIKDGDVPIGARTKATVVKNKVAPPFRKCEFDILFNEGINRLGEILDLGVDHGILKRSGTWLSYGETRLGQGRERAREFLRDNPEVAREVEHKILALVAPQALPSAEAEAADSDPAAAKDMSKGAGKGSKAAAAAE
jgi:recombination protein RecA